MCRASSFGQSCLHRHVGTDDAETFATFHGSADAIEAPRPRTGAASRIIAIATNERDDG